MFRFFITVMVTSLFYSLHASEIISEDFLTEKRDYVLKNITQYHFNQLKDGSAVIDKKYEIEKRVDDYFKHQSLFLDDLIIKYKKASDSDKTFAKRDYAYELYHFESLYSRFDKLKEITYYDSDGARFFSDSDISGYKIQFLAQLEKLNDTNIYDNGEFVYSVLLDSISDLSKKEDNYKNRVAIYETGLKIASGRKGQKEREVTVEMIKDLVKKGSNENISFAFALASKALSNQAIHGKEDIIDRQIKRILSQVPSDTIEKIIEKNMKDSSSLNLFQSATLEGIDYFVKMSNTEIGSKNLTGTILKSIDHDLKNKNYENAENKINSISIPADQKAHVAAKLIDSMINNNVSNDTTRAIIFSKSNEFLKDSKYLPQSLKRSAQGDGSLLNKLILENKDGDATIILKSIANHSSYTNSLEKELTQSNIVGHFEQKLKIAIADGNEKMAKDAVYHLAEIDSFHSYEALAKHYKNEKFPKEYFFGVMKPELLKTDSQREDFANNIIKYVDPLKLGYEERYSQIFITANIFHKKDPNKKLFNKLVDRYLSPSYNIAGSRENHKDLITRLLDYDLSIDLLKKLLGGSLNQSEKKLIFDIFSLAREKDSKSSGRGPREALLKMITDTSFSYTDRVHMLKEIVAYKSWPFVDETEFKDRNYIVPEKSLTKEFLTPLFTLVKTEEDPLNKKMYIAALCHVTAKFGSSGISLDENGLYRIQKFCEDQEDVKTLLNEVVLESEEKNLIHCQQKDIFEGAIEPIEKIEKDTLKALRLLID